MPAAAPLLPLGETKPVSAPRDELVEEIKEFLTALLRRGWSRLDALEEVAHALIEATREVHFDINDEITRIVTRRASGRVRWEDT